MVPDITFHNYLPGGAAARNKTALFAPNLIGLSLDNGT